MSIDSNKKAVTTWIDAVNRGAEPEILAMLTDDFFFMGMARAPEHMKYKWGGEQFAKAPKAMSTLMKKPIQLEIVSMIGEGDSVAVEAQTDGELTNGKKYDNAYHFVFAFRGNKIASVKEYCCTYLAWDRFGNLDPNEPEAAAAGAEA